MSKAEEAVKGHRNTLEALIAQRKAECDKEYKQIEADCTARINSVRRKMLILDISLIVFAVLLSAGMTALCVYLGHRP